MSRGGRGKSSRVLSTRTHTSRSTSSPDVTVRHGQETQGRSLAQGSEPRAPQASFPKPLAVHPGTQGLEPGLRVLPGSRLPGDWPPKGPRVPIGPDLQPLLGLIHFSLSPRPTRWVGPIFHASHLGPGQGCAVSSLSLNMCEPFVRTLAPEPQAQDSRAASVSRPSRESRLGGPGDGGRCSGRWRFPGEESDLAS